MAEHASADGTTRLRGDKSGGFFKHHPPPSLPPPPEPAVGSQELSQENKYACHKTRSARMFLTALFIKSSIWKQPKCPEERIIQVWKSAEQRSPRSAEG